MVVVLVLVITILLVMLMLLLARILEKQGTVVTLCTGVLRLFVKVQIVSAYFELLVDILIVDNIDIILVNSSHSPTRAIFV